MDQLLRAPSHLKELFAHEIEILGEVITGRIVLPEHDDYEQTRALAISNWDHQPALIVRAAGAADVSAALRFAREHDLEVAVRSGGHSTCGHGSSATGIVIDLRDVNRLEISTDKSSVWAGAGLTAGEVTAAVQREQMVVPFGDAASVGIGGLTLGGGVGYLARKHGLTIDSLLALELVTADGEVLLVDETSHPDLFWAVRGGGGNFGVVTGFRFRLHPLPEFVGGPLVMPPIPEVLAGFVAAAKAAPDELTAIIMVMPAPPMPFLPPAIHGQTIILGMMAFAGPAEQAQQALAPFRSLAEPIADLVGAAPYSAMFPPEDPGGKPAVSVRTLFMDKVEERHADKMLALLDECHAPMRITQIRVLGGAVARVPAEATAYANRNGRILTTFLAMDAPQALAQSEAWVSTCLTAFEAEKTGAYVNFLAEEGTDRILDAYPQGTWNRLREVKQKYDPTNVFRLNQNIPPAEVN